MSIKESKSKIIFIVAIVAVIVILGAVLGTKIFLDKKNAYNTQVAQSTETENNEIQEQETEEPQQEAKKEAEIFKGDDRPIAVMIDNHKGAWPQAGLNKT